MKKLYSYRFEIYLSIQMLLLFGALIFPIDFYDSVMTPLLFTSLILAGILMISKKKKLMQLLIALFTLSILSISSEWLFHTLDKNTHQLARILIYFIFNIIVTGQIITQIWREKKVDKQVIYGLLSGYISLGFIGFFLFLTISLMYTDAFTGGLLDTQNIGHYVDSLLYYSFITLLTIGYGDIIPAIPIAQKATILVGLAGQFYMVIITAVVLEKYIRLANKKK